MRKLSRDSFPHMVSTAIDLARTALSTACAHLLSSWWGVEMGRRCRFHGLPLIRRIPGSRIRIGESCHFRSAVWSNFVGLDRPCILATLRESARIEIGNRAGLSGTVIGAASSVVIGDDVLCGANCTITDTDWHPVDPRERLSGLPGRSDPVHIGNGVWLSMNVTVLKGVRIGEGTVVSAGSVVSGSLPAGVVAGGNPARVIREIGLGRSREPG